MMMSNVQAWLLLAVLVAGAVSVVVYLGRFERGASGVHSHADGTVHRHVLGGRRHEHPTGWGRWVAFLERKWGPAPVDARSARDEFRTRESA